MIDTQVLKATAHNQLDPAADLDNALKAFDVPPMQVNVRPNPLTLPNPSIESDQSQPEPVAEEEATEEDAPAADEEQSDEEALPFVKAFEGYFGMKPEEALETVNQLVAFKDEMTLMRQWGVSPTEYDQRMSAVREFYNTLPEDGRSQFNTIEGAHSIWEHLNKTGATTTKKSAAKPASRIRAASAPKQEFLKKSEILRMDAKTYQENLPRITKAFAEKRVIMDT
jgi:hypothetical protein